MELRHFEILRGKNVKLEKWPFCYFELAKSDVLPLINNGTKWNFKVHNQVQQVCAGIQHIEINFYVKKKEC